MGLYERLVKRNDDRSPAVTGRIPLHSFSALMAEVGRGRVTGAEAQQIITDISGLPLDASEITEAQTLLQTITTLNNATAKLARAKEIDDVLLLAEGGGVYGTPTECRARLGV